MFPVTDHITTPPKDTWSLMLDEGGTDRILLPWIGLRMAVNPPVLQDFSSIQPQLEYTMRISNISDFVTEEENGKAVNLRPSEPLFQETYSLWNPTVALIQAVAGIQRFLIFQRLPAVVLPGNSLGLEASEGPLVLYLLPIIWNLAKDDALINNTATSLIGRIENAAKAAGLFNNYTYLNYAANF